ncbi:MAG TPA: methionine adenosyltransferase, partial [Thermoanaerobaculia bacterium]|nr:methionine adenosyltransferase [Thermoanaerobaculia bacterium]
GVAAAECCLVSQIGRPVADPWIADIRVRLRDGRPAGDLAPELEAVVRDQLARLETLWREVLDGQVGVY